jgi:hypothetical protein
MKTLVWIAGLRALFEPGTSVNLLIYCLILQKPTGKYVYQLLKQSVTEFSRWCICGFLIILKVNNDYFLRQRMGVQIDLYNGEVLSFI